MTTGERMKFRRKELGLSADEVAAALNVSRATIFRYEKGDIEKLPGSALEPLAKALHTTPAYLMGWEESPSADIPTPPPSLPLQRLTQALDQLNDEGQTKLVDYADDLVSSGRYRPK